jgi:hypothetical protein
VQVQSEVEAQVEARVGARVEARVEARVKARGEVLAAGVLVVELEGAEGAGSWSMKFIKSGKGLCIHIYFN